MIAHPRHAEIAEYQEKNKTYAFETYEVHNNTKHSGYYMYHFNFQKFHVLPTLFMCSV